MFVRQTHPSPIHHVPPRTWQDHAQLLGKASKSINKRAIIYWAGKAIVLCQLFLAEVWRRKQLLHEFEKQDKVIAMTLPIKRASGWIHNSKQGKLPT